MIPSHGFVRLETCTRERRGMGGGVRREGEVGDRERRDKITDKLVTKTVKGI